MARLGRLPGLRQRRALRLCPIRHDAVFASVDPARVPCDHAGRAPAVHDDAAEWELTEAKCPEYAVCGVDWDERCGCGVFVDRGSGAMSRG